MAYSPAGNTTGSSGLSHLQTIYYNKRSLDRLQKKFKFRMACKADMVPKQSGRTVQWFRYTNPGAVLTPTVEGTPGTSTTLRTNIVQATVSQYTSFTTVSDFLMETAIDPIVSEASDLLGYQGGLTVDTITRNVIDSESPSTNTSLQSQSGFAKVADLRAGSAALEANDVRRFEDDTNLVIAHPFVCYDIVNDPAAGGLADIFKYTNPGASPLIKSEDRGVFTTVANCKVVVSTNVYTGTSGGNNTYRMYLFGYGGVGCLDLQGSGPADVVDPMKQRFNITAKSNLEASVADPERVIGAFVSYNFKYTAVILDGPAGIGGTFRYKTYECQSSIG